MSLLLFLRGPTTAFSGGDGEGWRELRSGVRLLPIGRMFTGNYINVNIARDMALLSARGRQYVAYYDPEGHVIVAVRRLAGGPFREFRVPIPEGKVPFRSAQDGPDLFDPHHFISLQRDGRGYLHLAYGHHNSPLHYWRTRRPDDPGDWERPQGGFGCDQPDRVTYVSFARLRDGRLLALFRVGQAGSGEEWLARYDPSPRRWQPLARPLIADGLKSSPYLWRPVVSPDGKVHLAWTWRLSEFEGLPDAPGAKRDFGGFTNKDISYACSSDGGDHWSRSDGTRYALPITRSTADTHQAETIAAIPMGVDFFNHYGSDFDAQGRPHFVYTRRDGDGIPQQWHLRQERGRWCSSVVSDYKSRFSWTHPQQDGLASTYLARPSVLIGKGGEVWVLSRSHERGDRLEVFVAGPGPSGPVKPWVAFDGSLGGWEPQVDLDRWHEQGLMDLLVVGVTDKALIGQPEFSAWAGFKRWLKGLFPLRGGGAPRLSDHPVSDYYSRVWDVEPRPLDPRLKDNEGFILEIDPVSIAP